MCSGTQAAEQAMTIALRVPSRLSHTVAPPI